jgi:outer membrane lipoprotein SlyB
MLNAIVIVVSAITLLAGCAVEHTSSNYYRGTDALSRSEVEGGSVVRVRLITIEGSVTPSLGLTSNLAGIAGAIAGAALGSQIIGNGRGRYVAASVTGPIAGLVAQQAAMTVSNPVRSGLEIVVRTDSGRVLAVTQDADQRFALGDRVLIVSGSGGMRVTR